METVPTHEEFYGGLNPSEVNLIPKMNYNGPEMAKMMNLSQTMVQQNENQNKIESVLQEYERKK